MSHPANLWIGTEMEAPVDRLLLALDAERARLGLPSISLEPGVAAKALLQHASAHRDLPRGDAWEPEVQS